jgi:hypothetical protein
MVMPPSVAKVLKYAFELENKIHAWAWKKNL